MFICWKGLKKQQVEGPMSEYLPHEYRVDDAVSRNFHLNLENNPFILLTKKDDHPEGTKKSQSS